MRKKKIWIVDDDPLISELLAKYLRQDDYEVRSESEDFEAILQRVETEGPDLLLLDIFLPGRSGIEILEELHRRGLPTQVIMLTSDDTAETAVKCMKLGAADYLTKPFNIEEVKIVLHNVLEKENLKHEVKYLRQVYSELFEKEIIGGSEMMRELKAQMAKVARARVPSVLITGESGTGKELVARSIHRMMNEENAPGTTPFIAVNCAALPENLLEAELFGYEKGAFTDAKNDKKGIFELASGGTILLDEIGEMRPSLQSKLLRVLEERTIRRIGGQKETPIELTVIATTNRDLAAAVERGDFRIDLFHRLNTFSLYAGPLRERREDIPQLCEYFLAHFGAKYNNKSLRGISPEAAQALCAYHWPGNVRELRNVIERIIVLENSALILPQHLPKEIAKPTNGEGPAHPKFVLPDSGISLEDLERDLIRQALQRAGNNKVLAAKHLHMTYDSLRYQIKKFGLDA